MDWKQNKNIIMFHNFKIGQNIKNCVSVAVSFAVVSTVILLSLLLLFFIAVHSIKARNLVL